MLSGRLRPLNILETGNLVPLQFILRSIGYQKAILLPNHDGSHWTKDVSLEVRADSQIQILRITNYKRASSVYHRRHRVSIIFTHWDTLGRSQDAFEPVMKEIPPTPTFALDFGVSGYLS